MIQRLVVLLSVLLVTLAASAQPAPPVISIDPPTRVIVELDGAPAALAHEPVATERHATLERFRRDLGTLAPRIASHGAKLPVIRREYTAAFFGAAVEVPHAMLPAVRALPYVRSIHEDHRVTTLATPATNDGDVVDAGQGVNSLALPTRGDGVRVGIIDTGIDYTHPALGGAFGPGHKVAAGWDFVNDDADPRDDNGHGTHVAGTIAADAPDLIGVAPHATLYAFKALNENGAGYESDILAAIERTVDPNGDGDLSDHLDVVNMSLGGLGASDDPQSRAVDNAVAAGVVYCVAAGNAGGFAIVLAPGTSVSAITVGAIDATGHVTSFSSRGPTPRDLHFKPDVVAPGAAIISSWPGGGTQSLNGTSMATPHVAGVCALLRKLHPDWTPADVKAALTSTATKIEATPVERGAGRVDAQRANEATTFLSESGLSFGLDATSDATWTSSRSFIITNRGAASRTYSFAAADAPAGITLTIDPASVTLGAGESRRVDVAMSVNNGTVAFTDVRTRDGAIRISGGSESVSLPWTMVRSARITIALDSIAASPIAYGSSRLFIAQYATNRAEAYVEQESAWEFLLFGYDIPDDGHELPLLRMISMPQQTVRGDALVTASLADAPYLVAFDARDENGVPLDERSHAGAGHAQFLLLHLYRNDQLLILLAGRRASLYVSSLPAFRYTAFQLYADTDSMEFYGVRYQELRDVAATTTLTKDLSSYVGTRFRWIPNATHDHTLLACVGIHSKTVAALQPFTYTCLERPADRPMLVRYFETPDTGIDSYVLGLHLESDSMLLPVLRDDGNGGIVASADAVPGTIAARFDTRGATTVGEGPLHPASFLAMFSPVRDSVLGGPFGELRPAESLLTSWTLFDAMGVALATGRFEPSDGTRVLQPAGGRLVAHTGGIAVAGTRGTGDLVVQFGSSINDPPPFFTSLRIVDASGAIVSRVAQGDAAALRFSAADYGFKVRSVALPVTEKTRVTYRIAGTAEWKPLDVVVEKSESGSSDALHRAPAGDIYRVDLSQATASAGARVDLRIDIEDRAGNRVTWTQSPALLVGEPAKKRRSVR